MSAAARTLDQRIQDTLDRLSRDVDMWVATADGESGTPYLAPFSFLWDGEVVLMASPSTSRTSRNLLASGKVRLGIGPTRDLILIEGRADPVADGEMAVNIGDAFAVKTGFDPRAIDGDYFYFRITLQKIQAWREVNELEARDLMRDGKWFESGQ